MKNLAFAIAIGSKRKWKNVDLNLKLKLEMEMEAKKNELLREKESEKMFEPKRITGRSESV